MEDGAGPELPEGDLPEPQDDGAHAEEAEPEEAQEAPEESPLAGEEVEQAADESPEGEVSPGGGEESPGGLDQEQEGAGDGEEAEEDGSGGAEDGEEGLGPESFQEDAASPMFGAAAAEPVGDEGSLDGGNSFQGFSPPAPSTAEAPQLSLLAKAYEEACGVAHRKVSALVKRSLLESAEVGAATFWIEAPGNHKHAFTSRLADQDMVVFAQVFRGSVPFLARLDLSYNLITDAGAELLASAVLSQGAASLAVLSLRGNGFGAKGCTAVCAAARQCPSLRRLDVSHNPLGRAGVLMVVELVKVHKGLLELMLADTEMDIVSLVALLTALLVCEPQLKVLDIENPRLTTLQEEHVVHLGRMLRVNTYLSELYLGKHRLRDEGIRQLVSFLLENKTLRVLDLRCNELGAEGAEHLGTLLASDCQLSRLNLSGNRIGEKDNVEGARALGQALQSNRMLRHLDLNHNSLCGKALHLLAEAMDRNSTLETLALFHNQWDQPSSYKFHQILHDRARMLPLRTDFVTSQVDLRIDVCKYDALDSA